MSGTDDLPSGHRRQARGGPTLRTDVVDVYVWRAPEGAVDAGAVELLQFRRAGDPLRGTWQPIMGHAEPGETAARAALRELEEEAGLSRRSPGLLGFWALEQVSPFYVSAIDAVVLSPRFAARVAPGWSPLLCPEHDALRWVRGDDAGAFMWPGQRAAVREIVEYILRPSAAGPVLRLDPDVV